MKSIEVEVFGQRLTLHGDGDATYAQELAKYVESQMRTASQGMATITPTKVAILAAINITDQLFQQEKRRQAEEAEIERRTSQILETIEDQINS
jgi:cell division protein ZapA